MSSPKPEGRFSAYKIALKSVSARTGTPLPSLLVSFGVLHELTAILPLVGVFYGARALGIGERVINAVVMEDSSSQHSQDGAVAWGRNVLKTWVDEGDRWATKVGTRYGLFGYEKGGDLNGVSAAISVPGHIGGDVANAIVAYGVTKAILPLRVGISIYLSPMFSRQVIEPLRKTLQRPFRR
ncbi:hypothetical protein K443DRAFT_671734 [Laccaria amethystina LaAM-08-1]|uniref:Uncharacterized protein n=1 Tax=Laccaria amethystina LaAM-08-1 TaxID=1095629 RepID=A0A0C9XAD9_9AGAR|nr:hypothetical protein K443DRAFT_671734 [Laccaria amethystina LaAM-08-1]